MARNTGGCARIVASTGARVATLRAAGALLRREAGGPVALSVTALPSVGPAVACAHWPQGARVDGPRAIATVSDDLLQAGVTGVRMTWTDDQPDEQGEPLTDQFPTRWLAHTADERFVVLAHDEPDLMAAAGEALGNLVVGWDSVQPLRWLRVEPAGPPPPAPDERLHAWLSELLSLLDARRFAVHRVVFGGTTAWSGAVLGEPLDEQRHEVHGAIKAVTWHDLRCEMNRRHRWRAHVVIDV